MKKILKLFAGGLTLVAGCSMAVAKPVTNVVDALENISIPNYVNNSQGDFEFSTVKMPTSVDAEVDINKKGFFIPSPAVSNSNATIKINVKDSRNTYTYTIDGSENKYAAYFVTGTENGVVGFYFKYNANTTYQVYFTAEIDGKIYSSSYYEVEVSGVSYSFDTENADFLPDIAGIGDKILVPTMTVVNSDGEEVQTTVSTKIIKNSTELAVSANGELTEDDGKLYLTPSEAATYTIRYTNVEYNLSKDYEINASESFNSANVVLEAKTLTMSSVEVGKEVTFPKAEVTDTYHNLEDVSTTTTITIIDEDGNETKLDADEYTYTFNKSGSYTVKYAISNFYQNNIKTLDVQIAEKVEVNDTLAPEVNFVADYNTSATDWEKDITILGDYAVPTKAGYNGFTVPAIYANDLGTNYSNLTFKRVLVSNSGTEYDIDNPEDNAALAIDYEADVTKAVKFAFHKEEGETDDAYIARVKGTYTLEYRATEVVGVNETKRTGSKSVTIQVLGVDAASYTDDTHLSISLPTISSSMKSSDVKTVSVSKATDDSDDSIETHYYFYYGTEDVFASAFANIKIEDKNYAYDFAAFRNAFEATKIDPAEDETYKLYDLSVENNKLSIELQDYVDATEFTVVAVAINDQGQFVIDTEEVAIKNSTTDLYAPTVDAVMSHFEKNYYILGNDEDSIVTLPEVTFKDLTDTHLNVSVKYYINSPDNGMKPVNGGYYMFDEINKTVSIMNGNINLTQQGTYYVVYTVKDDANNSYDFITSFIVEKAQVYNMKVEFDNSLDIYDTSEINAYVVDENGNKVDAEVDINFSGLMPEVEESEYTFNYAGDYSFEATAFVGGQRITSGTMTINVSEVSFKWNDEKSISVPTTSELSPSTEYELLTSEPSDWTENYAKYFTKSGEEFVEVTDTTAPSYTANTYYKKNELIYVQLTLPEANQNGKNTTASVKVTNPSGDAVEVIDVEVNGLKTGDVKFLAEKEGKYTIVFSAGSGDNKISKTFYCQVGDNNKPVVKIANKTQLQKDIVYDNNSITYKLTYALNSAKSSSTENVYTVTVKGTSNGETVFSYDVDLTLYDIDRVGNKKALTWADAIKNSSIKLNNKSSESSSEYVWTISSVDDYELKITATDTNGIESVAESIKFSVVDKSSIKEKEDNKVGIILIVISIIVLAGIICFFAFSGKSSSNKGKRKEEKLVEAKPEDEDKKSE